MTEYMGYELRDGIIVSPGKFEGEPLYVLSYWHIALEGGFDYDEFNNGTRYFLFDLSDEDRMNYPSLGDAWRLRLWEDDQGFVHHHLYEGSR